MNSAASDVDLLVRREYKDGFVTDIDSETFPPGLSEEVVRKITKIKSEPEFMLEWRLQAYRHWLTMTPPEWGTLCSLRIEIGKTFRAYQHHRILVKQRRDPFKQNIQINDIIVSKPGSTVDHSIGL